MVSIDTSLPFKVKGFNFDPANAFAAAQQTKGQILSNESRELTNRGAEMQNAMSGMQLEEATGQFNAMQDYRKRAAGGDANATDALKAYPELQLNVAKALDGLDEHERFQVVSKGKDVAEAARRVSAYPEGSPERAKAWNSELDRLLAEGDITQEWADANRDNVSQADLDEALQMGETLDQYIARKDAEKKAALEEAKARPKTEADLTLSQRLEIEQAARERVKAQIGSSLAPPDPEVSRQMFIDAKNDILNGLGIKPSDATVTPTPTEGGEIGLGEPAAPAETEKATPSAWTTLSPEAQTAATQTFLERISDPSIDRNAEIADFDAHFGEGTAAAVLKAHGDKPL